MRSFTSSSKSALIAAVRSNHTGNSAPTAGYGWRRTVQVVATRCHRPGRMPAHGVVWHYPRSSPETWTRCAIPGILERSCLCRLRSLKAFVRGVRAPTCEKPDDEGDDSAIGDERDTTPGTCTTTHLLYYDRFSFRTGMPGGHRAGPQACRLPRWRPTRTTSPRVAGGYWSTGERETPTPGVFPGPASVL